MKKQPKERPAPEDLMVSETSVWICQWIFFGHLHRNWSLFSCPFQCAQCVSLWTLPVCAAIPYLHPKQGWDCGSEVGGVLLLPSLVVWGVNSERSQPLSSFNQNHFGAWDTFSCSLDVQGLQLNVGHSLSASASLSLPKSEHWEQRVGLKDGF